MSEYKRKVPPLKLPLGAMTLQKVDFSLVKNFFKDRGHLLDGHQDGELVERDRVFFYGAATSRSNDHRF